MWPDTLGALLTSDYGLSPADLLSVPLDRILRHLPPLGLTADPSRLSAPPLGEPAVAAPPSGDPDPRTAGAHTHVLRVLYRALAVLQPKGAADSSLAPQALLSARGRATLEADARPLVWDLLYNPRCLWPWRQLASLYEAAAAALLNDAAMAYTPEVRSAPLQPHVAVSALCRPRTGLIQRAWRPVCLGTPDPAQPHVHACFSSCRVRPEVRSPGHALPELPPRTPSILLRSELWSERVCRSGTANGQPRRASCCKRRTSAACVRGQ